MSIFTVTTLLGALTFPPTSLTVRDVEETATPSSLRISSAGHGSARPEPSSVHVKCTMTSPVYQPFAFGGDVASAVIVGTTVSTTFTRKIPCALTPCAFVAKQPTVVSPSAKVEPEDGLQVTGTTPSSTSVAPAVKVTVAPVGPVASPV